MIALEYVSTPCLMFGFSPGLRFGAQMMFSSAFYAARARERRDVEVLRDMR